MTPLWVKADMATKALSVAIFALQEADAPPELVGTLIEAKRQFDGARLDQEPVGEPGRPSGGSRT